MDKRQFERKAELLGAKTIRWKKHIKYLLANGRMVVVASTPSDVNSYKKAYSDLRRAASMPPLNRVLPDGPAPAELGTKDKTRFHPPARGPAVSDDPGKFIPLLGKSTLHSIEANHLNLLFESVSELVSVADEVESFWKLNADGRARVLMKLAERFAEVEVIGARSHNTSFRGFEWYLSRAPNHDPLLALWGFDWKMPITRSLCIKTHDGQMLLVETEAKRLLEGTPQIAIISLKDNTRMDELAGIETIGDASEPELNRYTFNHFIHTRKMPSRGLSFLASHEWLNPHATRPVIAEMLEVLTDHRRRSDKN